MVTIMLLAFFFLPFDFLCVHQKSTFMADRCKGNPWANGYAYELDYWLPQQVVYSSMPYCFQTRFIPCVAVLDPAPFGDKGIQALI